MKNDITKLSAYEIGLLLMEKIVDPINLVELFFENYTRAPIKTSHSICENLKKEALLEAEASWKRQKNNSRLSIFDGIPSGWKDVIDIKNYPAFGGSILLRKLRNNIKVKDAIVVSNARKKGIIPLFKTSTVEFAFGGLGINESVNYPNNQMLKNNYCPGGSSSGSAVAVYSNLIPMAVGTDTAGSIRIPSSWHSLIGFKPSFNNIPNKGILPLSKSYDTLGTICKTVRDTRIFYSILSDSKFINHKKKSKCKIGIISDSVITSLESKDQFIFEKFLTLLDKNDFNLRKIKIPEFNLANKIIEREGGIVNYEAWNFWKKYIKKDIEIIDKNVLSRFRIGKKISTNVYMNMKKSINELKEKIYSNLENIDFLILPTVSIKPPKINEVLNKDNYIFYNNLVLGNTRMANLFNFPAITIPIKKNYWLSFTILAKEKNDEGLLSIAEEIESILHT